MKEGYKILNADMTTQFGQKLEIGQKYFCTEPVVFGTQGRGWHFCERLEDALRFASAFNNNYVICKVIGSGNIVESFDSYNETFDMYSASELQITNKLSRADVINYILDTDELRIIRFITLYKLTPEEIILFKEEFFDDERIQLALSYYQEGNKDAYEKYNDDLNLKSL